MAGNIRLRISKKNAIMLISVRVVVLRIGFTTCLEIMDIIAMNVGSGGGQDDFDRLAEKDSKSNSSDEATDAKICAVKAVKDQLKSPSTAEFCKYTEMTATNLGGNKWKITGWVDAQNSFGATLRENWTVTLTLTDSGFKDATVTFD